MHSSLEFGATPVNANGKNNFLFRSLPLKYRWNRRPSKDFLAPSEPVRPHLTFQKHKKRPIMFRGMKSFLAVMQMERRASPPVLLSVVVMLVFFFLSPAPAQTLARRLILKDGSYQSVTKYEIQGERVRYFSAERGEWEEIPKSLIDWDATEKYEQGRLQGTPAPEAVQLDKELEAEQKAEEARSPHVAPGLRLPDDGGIFLLDTFENQPQLAELQQSGGEAQQEHEDKHSARHHQSAGQRQADDRATRASTPRFSRT